MSKFHVGDKVRLVDRDGLFDQFALDTYFDASDVSVITRVDTGAGEQYEKYAGVTYEIDDPSGVGWDVPEDVLRPAEIFAQVDSDLKAVTEAVDSVNHPAHYTRFPVEVIEITEQLPFNQGNVVKYVCRAGFKQGVDELEDLSKAAWYLNRAIEKLKKERNEN